MHKMNGNRYKLVITLKSDLCMGSGYSYAGIIDSDVCYDACGIPYIAARRLKGCLREAAEMIGINEEEISDIFGKPGDKEVTGIHIDNAYIDHYEQLRSDFEHLGRDCRQYITTQSMLEQFTTVKAQTKIGKNGVAKDNSLRYTRTVKHYSPFDPGEELCFRADVTMPAVPRELGEDEQKALEEKRVKILTDITRALRNIGMNRNRGLGSVRCRLVPYVGAETADAQKTVYLEKGVRCMEMSDENAQYILRYSVRNVSPLVLSTTNDFKTEKYISGRSVLGFFAGAYLRTSGKSAEDEEFKDIFLRNKVKFGALYPAHTTKDGVSRTYYPAPAYINCLKKTKKYVNVSKKIPWTEQECAERGIDAAYAAGQGNQPKRLTGKFVCLESSAGGSTILVTEPATDIVYHHTKKSEKQNAQDGNLLYTTEVLREQQSFTGEIRGQGKYIRMLAELLMGNILRFGKSKSSQYGACVPEGTPVILKAEQEKKVYNKGSLILAVLESDAVFSNEYGYTVRCRDVREQIRNSLNIEEMQCSADGDKSEEDIAGCYSEISSGILTGYYGKWNLQRPAVPVVKAGSTFGFRLAEDLVTEDDIVWAGEDTGEGFGRVRIIENKGNCCIKAAKEDALPECTEERPEAAGPIFRNIIVKEAEEILLRNAAEDRKKFSNSAALGRITLMLSESMAQPDDEAQYKDFVKRIESIKTESVKEQARKLMREWICKDGEFGRCNLNYLTLVEKLRKPYEFLCGEEGIAVPFEQAMRKLWSEYLMAVLVQRKYNMKYTEVSHE